MKPTPKILATILLGGCVLALTLSPLLACGGSPLTPEDVHAAGDLAEDLAECRIAALGTDASADAAVAQYSECARIARLRASQGDR